jgi:putative ABC transport system substrate-binding protein
MAFVGGAAIIGGPGFGFGQTPVPVLGFVNSANPQGYAPHLAAFLQGLKGSGFVPGRNVTIEYRWAEGHYDRLPGMIGDLIQRKVGVIAATSTPAAVAAKASKTTIPIVFTTSGDPVQLGLVDSLSRPGGNITGATQLNVEVTAKRLELVRQLFPSADGVGILVNPASPNADPLLHNLEPAAESLGLKLKVLHASNDAELVAAFASMDQQQLKALLIGTDPFFSGQAPLLADLALRHRVATIFQYPEFTAAGGLISFGGIIRESYLFAGGYAGRILKGERASDLPVQQVTKIELILNLKTAKSLGLIIPQTILARADEVIE